MGFLKAVVSSTEADVFIPGVLHSPSASVPGLLSDRVVPGEISDRVMLITGDLLGQVPGSFSEGFPFSHNLRRMGHFYYVWLKVLLDWPSTLLDWDVSLPYTCDMIGPVLAPVICSCTMIVLGGYFLVLLNKAYACKNEAL